MITELPDILKYVQHKEHIDFSYDSFEIYNKYARQNFMSIKGHDLFDSLHRYVAHAMCDYLGADCNINILQDSLLKWLNQDEQVISPYIQSLYEAILEDIHIHILTFDNDIEYYLK